MIRSERGNIWDYGDTHLIVIPTNIGWRSSDARNVMGRGLALQAAKKYPDFPVWYGLQCKEMEDRTPVLRYPGTHLLAFPVKPLNKKAPWLSWRNKADVHLIERSAEQLARIDRTHPVAVSMVGCGNGGLAMEEVRPILDRHLSDGAFVLVLYGS